MILEGGSFSGRERNCAFLNTKGGRFGNISGVSGLDFADDGRGLATVDWDHDGDLDVWLANRTGPQVRFMRNDTATRSHFLAVRLEGRTSNRDGIGARLELVLRDQPGRKIIQSLRAGEGYLSQSSKWVHFGLGSSTEIDRLTVRWPGGQAETFAGLQADARYRLIQGSGEAEVWIPPHRSVALTPRKLEAADNGSGSVHVRLSSRVPIGPMTYQDFAGRSRSIQEFSGKPILLNLWASWCPPCIKELGDFAGQAQTLRENGLEIIALSVDGLDDQPGQPQEVLDRLKFPFASGLAQAPLLHQLEMIRNQLFDWRRPFAVPTSFLIDSDGWIAAIYLSPVEVDRLLTDLKWMSSSRIRAQEQSLPFEGRWLSPISQITRGQWNRELAGAYSNSALDLYRAGRLKEAEAEYRRALRLNPNDATIHNNLGVFLASRGRAREAIAEYREVLRIDPESIKAHSNLGHIYLGQSNLEGAERMFRKALELNQAQGHKQGMAANYGILGNVYYTQGDLEKAERVYRKALALNQELGRKESIAANYGNLGNVYSLRGNLDQAEAMHKQALALHQALNQKQGTAADYVNLGNVYSRRGNLDQAEAMHKRALALNEELGRQEGIARSYGNLGEVYYARGDLKQAEAMYKQALELNRALGYKEGMATDYGSLGQMYSQGGELSKAEEMWTAALALFEDIGAKLKAEQIRRWLEDIRGRQ